MCGRFTQRFSWREVHSFLRLGTPAPALNLRPRYNLAPSQNAAVVRDEDGERRLSMLRWGLIPGWAKDPSIGHKLINARVETAAARPSFRAAYSKRRCLVPADGFYEWRREGEDASANSVRFNDLVLVPAGFPKTAERLAASGYNVRRVANTEAAKLDGGMSCLSVRFSPPAG